MTRYAGDDWFGSAGQMIQVGSFRPDQHTGLRGSICFSTPNGPFPAPQWSDAPAALLADWMRRFGRLLSGKTRRTQFGFMEGPYTVRVEAQGVNVVLAFIDRGRDKAREILPSLRVSITALGDALLAAATLALNTAQQAGWTGVDIGRLEAGVRDLTQEMKRRQSDQST